MQKAKKVAKQKVYVGIADCHGIDGCGDDSKSRC